MNEDKIASKMVSSHFGDEIENLLDGISKKYGIDRKSAISSLEGYLYDEKNFKQDFKPDF